MAQTKEERAAYRKQWHATKRDTAKHAAEMRVRHRIARGVVGATAEMRDGPCAICQQAGPLHCDHDHATGRIRGWLCRKCNLGLGCLGDNLQGLDRARAYLLADPPE